MDLFVHSTNVFSICLGHRPKKLTLKSYKSYWTVFKDTHLAFFRNKEEAAGPAVMKINVRGIHKFFFFYILLVFIWRHSLAEKVTLNVLTSAFPV